MIRPGRKAKAFKLGSAIGDGGAVHPALIAPGRRHILATRELIWTPDEEPRDGIAKHNDEETMKGPRWWTALAFAYVAVINFARRRIWVGYRTTLAFPVLGVPITCVFPFVQMHCVKGILIGAVKT
jgi:hypothetical protein